MDININPNLYDIYLKFCKNNNIEYPVDILSGWRNDWKRQYDKKIKIIKGD